MKNFQYWFAGLFVGGLIGTVIGISMVALVVAPHTCPLPSLTELQEIVGAKPDGKICKSWNVPGHSETGEKWDAYICEQFAAKATEPYVGDDGYLGANWK